MAFQGNFSCNTLRAGLANASINLTTDTFYLALYTNDATLSQTTTEYTTTGEATGGDYVAGGLTVAATVTSEPTASGSVTYVSFSSPAWTGIITARGALIYKAGANGAICVLDFGNDKTSSNTFTVTMPANTSTSALIRLV
jgi:hypothetical protein